MHEADGNISKGDLDYSNNKAATRDMIHVNLIVMTLLSTVQ